MPKASWPKPNAKELFTATKLGFELEGGPVYHFDIISKSGPWWGTRWKGCFDLQIQLCKLSKHPPHPHVFHGLLCVDVPYVGSLLTWVQVLITLWQVTDLDNTFSLKPCTNSMIAGLKRNEKVCHR